MVGRFADNSVETCCVAFSELSITALNDVTRSGLQVISGLWQPGRGVWAASQEPAVRPHAGLLRPLPGFSLASTGPITTGWAAAILASRRGRRHGHRRRNGRWSWGAGNFSSGVEPPAVAFNDVLCATGDRYTDGNRNRAADSDTLATATATVRRSQDQTPPRGRLRGEHDEGLCPAPARRCAGG